MLPELGRAYLMIPVAKKCSDAILLNEHSRAGRRIDSIMSVSRLRPDNFSPGNLQTTATYLRTLSHRGLLQLGRRRQRHTHSSPSSAPPPLAPPEAGPRHGTAPTAGPPRPVPPGRDRGTTPAWRCSGFPPAVESMYALG
jgi:hypothetical protein